MTNRLLAIAVEHRRTLLASILLQALQSYAGMMTIIFFQRVIDALRYAGNRSFSSALGIFVALTALNHLLIYAQGYPQRMFKTGTYLSVKRLAMRKLARIDYRSYVELDTGTTLQVVENGANSGSSILYDFWLFVVITGLTLPVQLYLIQMYDFVLFLTVIGGYGALFAVAQLLMRVSKATMERVVSRKEELSKRLARGFMEMVSFRIQRQFAAEIGRVDSLSKDVAMSEGRIGLVNELFFTGFALLVFMVEVTVIVRQAALIASGESSVGVLVALVMFVRSVFAPVSSFSFAYVMYKMNRIPWRRFDQFLEKPDDTQLALRNDVPIGREEPLHLHSVSFRYAETTILDRISLTIRPGHHLAIVGSSGAGKTTLLRILLGLLKPDEGTVVIGEQDLSLTDLGTFYEAISFVSQDAPVFEGTLRENLVEGRVVPDDDVWAALETTQLRSHIEKLGLGLETRTGERGVSLSAGERQRIALARVLLSPAPLVFLDEPTSALDSETEAAVMKGFFASMGNRTVVMVAHRLQPVRLCDDIVVIEHGKVVQEGSFSDLSGSSGRFRELWHEQTRG
jgi:ATP-binding cassette, subfamily B, bacterial